MRYLKLRIASLERTITGRSGRINHLLRMAQGDPYDSRSLYWDSFELAVLRQLKTGRELIEMKGTLGC